ncbi:hypothetical protein O2U01_07275 [Ligilactobacillus salivarius]|uniref:Uncharacterized protein n=1 Tax=Ligilactobacillus salivarius TaxID=1624 RepID=A0ABD7YWC6_9LACO|nr:hypothetical protein [Ligilactobacillus salivarius]WHS06770.1 hypothetical protein O2U07_05685 [Ligilactobacillus salivarius]WHS08825.1 hypothetical protein O2U05_05070 [Ligilactobacillus salivarius]WHS10733.1 hypothetical protein O2U04_04025 [Ligilactobacillus salivarius]WHS14672.1 hypothetical protein O2U03_03230 [Ligilactobacillus salivarius]WHS18428.1 hypothetical protein O2U02_04205 [Ligilactobacillus salivarius]
MKITDIFSVEEFVLLTIDEDLPEEIWIGDKVKINGELFTIAGIPIIDRTPPSADKKDFMIDRTDKTDKVNINQIVEFYKG